MNRAAWPSVSLALAVVVAGCTSGGGTSSTSTSTTEPAQTATTASAPSPADTQTPPTVVETSPDGQGTLVYGLQADSVNPWAHYAVVCEVSCQTVMGALGDTLAIVDQNRQWRPNLAQRIVRNSDNTVWTITLRTGITFHDGSPLDGEAVRYYLNSLRASPLTGPALAPIADVSATERVITITMNQPWVSFPFFLATCPGGCPQSKTWLQTLSNNPLRASSPITGDALIDSETTRTEPTGDVAAPVGTGPYRFVSYTPGAGNSFVVERNPDYCAPMVQATLCHTSMGSSSSSTRGRRRGWRGFCPGGIT